MRTLAAAVAIAVASIACGTTPDAGGGATQTSPPPRQRPPLPPTTPSPSACTTDAECTVAMIAPGPDPCCDVTVTSQPLSIAYLQAVAAYRARECAGVTCPPGMLPGAMPAPCAFEARCIAGACSNACGSVPPSSGPPPTPRS